MSTSPATGRNWSTPSGTLSVGEDGSARALVRNSLRNNQTVAAAVTAVAGLKQAPFLRCTGFQQEEQGLVLVWPSDQTQRIPLTALVPAWRQQPAAHVAQALEMALRVSRAASELEHFRPLKFLLSPVQVFLAKSANGREEWAILPLPVEGAGFRDFATASPDVIAWFSGDDFIGGATPDRTHMLGAALYYCLIGEPYPARLSRTARLQRMISYRAGNPAQVRLALATAIPKPLGGAATRLAQLIVASLEPNIGRAMTTAQAVHELERLQTELAPPTLADAWDALGNEDYALKILDAFARSAPKSEVPWEALASLRKRTGQHTAEAHDAEPSEAHFEPVQEDAASLVAQVRMLAARGDAGRSELERVVTRLRSDDKTALAEDEYLYLAYANARWLGNIDESVQLLARDFVVTWHKALQALIIARLAGERASWGQVGRSCRDCKKIIAAMPNRGSERGCYAMSYANLLDAIAHMRAVANGQSHEYLVDAWERLKSAWSLMQEARAHDLEEDLLTWLATFMRQVEPVRQLATLKLGIHAFCQSAGVKPGGNGNDRTPPIPWFDDRWLFT